jgi:hypothetical protein
VDILTAEQIDRIYGITRTLGVNPNYVIVPLKAVDEGRESIMPDGKLLVRGPAGAKFEPWLEGLRERLLRMDLSRTRG